MELKLITPDEKIFAGPIRSITLPGAAGELTVLPGHTFLLSTLARGKIVYRNSLGNNTVTITGGLVEVERDTVTVLAQTS